MARRCRASRRSSGPLRLLPAPPASRRRQTSRFLVLEPLSKWKEISTRTRHPRTHKTANTVPGRDGQKRRVATPTKRLRDLNADGRRDACDRNASIRENSRALCARFPQSKGVIRGLAPSIKCAAFCIEMRMQANDPIFLSLRLSLS